MPQNRPGVREGGLISLSYEPGAGIANRGTQAVLVWLDFSTCHFQVLAMFGYLYK
jgi:hypothetical protein